MVKKRWYGSPIIIWGMWINNFVISVKYFTLLFFKTLYKTIGEILLIIGSILIGFSISEETNIKFIIGLGLIFIAVALKTFSEIDVPKFHNIWDYSKTVRKKWEKEFSYKYKNL